MEVLRVSVQGLASYLMIISLLGVSSKIWNFIESTTSQPIVLDRAPPPCNGSSCSNEKYRLGHANTASRSPDWDEVSFYLELFYEYTFPVIIPLFSKELNSTYLRKAFSAEVISILNRNTEGISTSSFLSTLLPSFFLFKGAFRSNYSNCKFWYYTQVGSLLLTCFKLVLVTLLDLWNAATTGTLISLFLGLTQLWLVQSFMERLGIQVRKSQHQTKFVSQLLALHDFDSLDICKIVGRKSGDEEDTKAML